MRHTLTAVFDKPGDAQHALNKLHAAGYSMEDTALSIAAPTGQSSNGDRTRAGEESRLGLSAKHLFARLLGTGRTGHSARHTDASPGGRNVVTLTTESETEAKRAVELVGRLMSTNGGDDRAACRYGNEMHVSEKYRNRSWNEVDKELKSGWELRYPGASTWDASGLAMRRGWDDASPDIDEDSYYRTHWNARYAHDASGKRGRALANGIGNKGRDGFQYHLRHWTAAAADRKAAWALRHGGELPPWEKFKDALLHGWGGINLGNDDTKSL
jgi:hypothetical protein